MLGLGLGLVLFQLVAYRSLPIKYIFYLRAQAGRFFSCERAVMSLDARVRVSGRVSLITACCFHKLACWRSFVVVRV